MTRAHSDREYEAELQHLRAELSKMGACVADMIADSMRALVERNSELARATIEFDHEVNLLEVETDELCLGILARRQPVASDLRFITMALKLVTDLERIGDLCVNICERAIELNAEEPLKEYVDLPKMAGIVEGMVRAAMNAFVARDASGAGDVVGRDRSVDALYAQLFRELLSHMTRDPETIYRATRIQAIGKYLERIGDHATNLAEMVIFMVKGKDVRHLGRLKSAAEPRLPHGILFLCVANSARSQMAEGWARTLLPPSVRIWSAGSQPADEVHPAAVQVMTEVGIDISRQRPKRVSDVALGDVDTIVTLCAEEVCISMPGDMRREAWVFPDPATVGKSSDDPLSAFRDVRERIHARLSQFAAQYAGTPGSGGGAPAQG